MPTILPISDLRNYTEVLKLVDVDGPVYLTRNGRDCYVISKLDDYDHGAAVEQLLTEVKKGELPNKGGGMVPVDKIAKKFNIQL